MKSSGLSEFNDKVWDTKKLKKLVRVACSNGISILITWALIQDIVHSLRWYNTITTTTAVPTCFGLRKVCPISCFNCHSLWIQFPVDSSVWSSTVFMYSPANKEVRESLQETTIQIPPEVKSACIISFRMFHPDRIQWKPISSSRQSLDISWERLLDCGCMLRRLVVYWCMLVVVVVATPVIIHFTDNERILACEPIQSWTWI